jgi:hypothetical protein
LLYLIEYEGLNRRQLARFPRRPAHLRLPRTAFAEVECLGPSWTVIFRDGGRAFQAHVYGPPRRRHEALTMLDSLRVRAVFVGARRAVDERSGCTARRPC